MPHDHPHHHGHHHHHGHDHAHAPDHSHGPGHNHAHDAMHLHSHITPEDEAADLRVLATQFIDGFQDAKDKAAYLKLAGIPLELPGGDGPSLKLVDVELKTEWQVGTASPSFGSSELSYLPFPGEMVTERTNLGFVYVSLREKRVVDLRDVLKDRLKD